MPHNPYRDYGCARTFLNRPRRWRSSASDYGACCSEARFGQGSARAHWAKPSCVNARLSRRHSVECYCLTSNAVATDEHHSYIINKGLSRWESNVGQANHRNYKSGRRGSNRRRPAWLRRDQNRHVSGDERALQERRTANPSWPRVLQAAS